MIFEYFTYLLIMNIWSGTAVKAELIPKPSSDLDVRDGTSDLLLSEISQGDKYEPRLDFDLIVEGFIGDWMKPYEAPAEYLACGIAIMNEEENSYDNTANNAIKLIFCQEKDWNKQIEQKLNEGKWGGWGANQMCPRGTYIHGARANFQDKQGTFSEDTAMNGIEIVCKNPTIEESQSTHIEVLPSKWGTWKDWVIKDTQYVCGGQVRFEPDRWTDDTALNGVRFKFCEWQTLPTGFVSIIDGDQGSWVKSVVAPSEYLACGVGLQIDPESASGDNTGLNGIRVKFCNINNWSKQTESTVIEGLYGKWADYMMCDQGYFVKNLKVKNVDKRSSGDNYALTGLRFECGSPGNPGKTSPYSQDITSGSWKDSKVYDKSYLCGFQGRLDSTRKGSGSDATGLNGVRVKYCELSYDITDFTLVTEGNFGQWLKPQIAPKDYYACGMQMKTDPYLSTKSDNIIADALKIIYCSIENWSIRPDSALNEGQFGGWQNQMMCPKNTFIHAVRAKVHPLQPQNGDDTSLNSIEIKCKHPKPGSPSTVVSLDYGQFGEWSSWVEYDKYICGGQVRFDWTEANKDATGLNGLRFKFCSYTFNGLEYEPIYTGLWGEWLKPEDSPYPDYFACGAALSMHPQQGDGDDSAANGLKLVYCKNEDWNKQQEVIVNTGFKVSNWNDVVMCPKDYFINGGSVKFEEYLGTYADDTALNGLKIRCQHATATSQKSEVLVENGYWGDWQAGKTSSEGFVCGAQVRFDSTSFGSDATALNGIAFKYCNIQYDIAGYHIISEGLRGEWLIPISGPTGYYACGMKVRTQAYRGLYLDDSFVNAVDLVYCAFGTWSFQSNTLLNDGLTGDWKSAVMCPKNSYINALSLRIDPETRANQDDTASNGIKFKCKNPKPKSKSVEVIAEEGNLGNWSPYVEFNKYVCGAQVRFDFTPVANVEETDSTALNGLKAKFCNYQFTGPYYEVIAEGYWGTWSLPPQTQDGYAACGFSSKVQNSPINNDIIGVTALKIVYCKMNDWTNQLTIDLNNSPYGEWRNPVMCHKGSYINGAQAKVEEPQGTRDDSAFNRLNFKCTNPLIPLTSKDVMMEDMIWGTWGEWVSYPNKYVCDGQVRSDPTIPGDGRDATGLNGLSLKFCDFDYDTTSYVTVTDGLLGDWLNPVEVPEGYYACGISARNQPFQGDNDDTAMNAIKFIFCSFEDWNNQIGYNLNEGLYGEWNNSLMCPANKYVSGISAKVVSSKGDGDDTAMNDISLKCTSPNPKAITSTISYDFSSEGTWTDMVEKDQFICGGQVRFDPTSINIADATALNGLRVKFCPYPKPDPIPDPTPDPIPDDSNKPVLKTLEEGNQGSWLDVIDAPTNTFACGVALKYSPDISPKGNYPIDAIKLIYCGSDWNTQSEKNINDGVKGSWKKSMLCPKDTYIYSARAKIEPINGPFGDEFVLSGVEFKCNRIRTSLSGIPTTILADNGGWGTWREWVEYENRFVCGAAAKFDSNEASQNGTGVFGLRLQFCKAQFQ